MTLPKYPIAQSNRTINYPITQFPDSPIRRGTYPVTVAARTLQQELEEQIEGEVRFDGVSRALYSTDASVYQIVPLGVVIPGPRTMSCGRSRSRGGTACSITARGGGTSQAGQAIGAGLQLDTSKYFNRCSR